MIMMLFVHFRCDYYRYATCTVYRARSVTTVVTNKPDMIGQDSRSKMKNKVGTIVVRLKGTYFDGDPVV